jgi:O-acetyl-ADP-ribose deacetylase (regulator of RNase III)
MSLNYIKSNLFDTKMDAIVCPVNCVGVMGAGLAKEFSKKFDNNTYYRACLRGELAPGSVLVRQPAHAYSDTKKTLIYFATKYQWYDNSKMDWITNGMNNLFQSLKYYNIKSVALPAVGAGLGKLDWKLVKDAISDAYINGGGDAMGITLEVYEPL